MSQQVDAYLKQIENLENISLDERRVAILQDPGNIFCTSWPVAKQVLEAIRDMVKNPLVKAAITTIISLGDGLYKLKCQAKPA